MKSNEFEPRILDQLTLYARELWKIKELIRTNGIHQDSARRRIEWAERVVRDQIDFGSAVDPFFKVNCTRRQDIGCLCGLAEDFLLTKLEGYKWEVPPEYLPTDPDRQKRRGLK